VKILFLGPPGAGKGTQSKILAQRFDLLHISPGDIFRQEVRAGTDLGRLVEEIMARGELVPDDITVKVIEKRLLSLEARKGFVLDGFPRNIAQAHALDEVLSRGRQKLDLVINLMVPEEELLERARTRRVCSVCGRPYNLKLEPPKVPGKCDECGGELVTRKDDSEETVKERLRVYNEITKPLYEYYNQKGIMVSINGCADVGVVFSHILSTLSERGLIPKEAVGRDNPEK